MPFSLYSTFHSPTRKSFVQRHPVLVPLVLFLLIFIGFLLFSDQMPRPGIGIVEVEGVILESEPTIRRLRAMEKEESVKGIIVRINSPGGAVSPSQEIFSELLRLKKRKKVYVSISSSAASGGYYIAIGAEKIFANPGSMIGSIGVIMQTFNISELMEKIGIRSEVVKSAENKDLGSLFREMSPEERRLLKYVIDDTHDQFVSAIADNRPLELEKVKEIADGRIFTGRQALKLNLIDKLGSMREVVDILRRDLNIEGDVELIYPKKEEEILESILNLESLLPLKKWSKLSGLFFLAPSAYTDESTNPE